ncbi:MAG: hydrogenase expression/formation protein HypE, partial [Candidatus Eisenbacteria bacterium]|nr:hydrogenase expression/formation protein HypE [Candidatus Eisenbacteria bacterium]
EILGLDPLYVACEGRMIVVAGEDGAEAALESLRAHPYGREAATIGRIVSGDPGRVALQTRIGGRRVLDMLSGEQLPRIC